jgi:hypothetical protein
MLGLTPDTLYDIVLDVYIVANVSVNNGSAGPGGSETLSAFLDPIITANDPNYSILLSPDVGNSAATALPAGLPLFATGLGAMGLFGWRTRRKNTTAIAAA